MPQPACCIIAAVLDASCGGGACWRTTGSAHASSAACCIYACTRPRTHRRVSCLSGCTSCRQRCDAAGCGELRTALGICRLEENGPCELFGQRPQAHEQRPRSGQVSEPRVPLTSCLPLATSSRASLDTDSGHIPGRGEDDMRSCGWSWVGGCRAASSQDASAPSMAAPTPKCTGVPSSG